MKQASLGEIAIKLGVNKSKLSFYFSSGLLKPIMKVGKMNVFDLDKTMKIIKKIGDMKKKGHTLEYIKSKS